MTATTGHNHSLGHGDGQDIDHVHAGPDKRSHHHGVNANADRRYLIIALTLLTAFMIFEVVVAIMAGSLALLSDSGHMLSDVGAIAVALWAISLAARPAAHQAELVLY